MSEKHVKYPLASATADNNTGEIMYRIFTFISSSGQAAVRFAYNSTATSVSSSVGYGGTPTSFSDFPSGSFIVVEPVTAMPSGYRWQVKIERSATNTIRQQMSTVGGWEGNSTKNFISNSTNNPPNITPPTTDFVNFIATSPASGSYLLVSTADSDTYGSNNTPATYFRYLTWAAGAVEGSQFAAGVSFGSYIPYNTSSNTNPVYLLAGNPNINTASTNQWSVNATSNNRVPPNFRFDDTSLTTNNAAGGITTVSLVGNNPGESGNAKGLNNVWVNFPVVVCQFTKYAAPGYLGTYNLMGGHSGRTDGTPDSKGEYMVVNNLMIRWKPSA